ncbi:MAG: ATP-binding cassette domain-containing protein [Acidobacteriota bacterium]
MSLRVHTEALRKVYTSPPPLAGAGRGLGLPFGAGRTERRQKYEVVALDDLTLDVHPGELFGLLGPNGAGKSTTVGVLTTRIRPTGGRAWIGKHEVWNDPVAVKRLIGVVPQRPNLDFSLTAREILLFHGAYFGMPASARTARAGELLERFQLADRADRLVVAFSGGMMQRLSIARAMMHDPQVLFLDEPSAGLDPQTRLLLRDIVREYHGSGRTIVLTTHNMEEADELCERVAIVDHGRVIALGSPAELKRSVPGGHLIRMQVQPRPPSLLRQLERLAGVTEVRPVGENVVDLYADRGGALVPEAINAALLERVEIRDVHISEPSLENLFLHHTGRSLRD